ncbi:MAG TPA: hypothetical protein PKI61_02060 [bacterium]|nr:hypothetical protein [bacterium]HPT29649.1 hypothetical protein [bacterium]
MKERMENSFDYINKVYEKEAEALSTMVLGKFKDVRAKHAIFTEEAWSDLLFKAKDSLKGKLSFPPDVSRLNYLALEKLLSWQSQEPDLSGPTSKFFVDKYLSALKDEITTEALATGEDFYEVLSRKLKEAKVKGLELDNDLINGVKNNWANEYYDKLSNVA